MSEESDGRKKSGGFRFALRVFMGLLAAPPEIKAIFRDAQERMREEAKKLDAESPGWRSRIFDGPESEQGFVAYVNTIASERGKLDEIKKWMKQVFKDAREP